MTDVPSSSQDKSASRPVRDLRWCLASAPLIAQKEQDAGGIWPTQTWFEGLAYDEQGEPPSPPASHHFRLGQHFEALIQHWLATSRQYTLVRHNWQVIAHKHTVGEFDLIVRDQLTRELEHWELAVKFYLGTGDLSWPCWYGPNTSDRLDLKMERLITHQLTLSTQPEPKEVLDAAQLSIARIRCFMKGRLFYPWELWHSWRQSNEQYSDVLQPQDIQPQHSDRIQTHPQHARGWWLPADDLSAVFDTSSRFVYLPKRLWLSPLTASDIVDTVDIDAVTAMVQGPRAQQAMHFAEVTDAGEISRGFIVSSRWLERVG